MMEGARQQGRRVRGARVRTATPIAWSLWLVVVVFVAASFDLSGMDWYILTHPRSASPGDIGGALIFLVLGPTLIVAYTTVGAMVASLRPINWVGWLCLAVGLVTVMVGGVSWVAERMDIVFLLNWLNRVAWTPIMVPLLAVTLMLLIFPDGRLPSRRWRFAVWTAVVGTCLITIAESLMSSYSVVEVIRTVGFSASWTGFLASVAAVAFRWRRSRGQERQQLKWLIYTFAVTIIAGLCALTSWYIQADIPGAWSYSTVLSFVVALAGIMVGIPAAIGVAVLKYRLYDIDRIINRTLVYGALTVLLVAVYVGSVVSLQGALRTMTGQKSQLAIVASTLIVAAIFNPLRRRIQSFIDHRFYRRKYDARKTLEAFSSKLRDETDLEALNDDLVGVVAETMQPAHVSLWLRPATDAKVSGQAEG